MDKHYIGAIATLIGTIVGAGILGIPYVMAKSGFLVGITELVVIGLMILIINLFLGEVVLRTKGNHQLTGYAAKYLGKKGKLLMMITMIIGNYGALIAYLLGEGQTLSAIFGLTPIVFTMMFFIVFSILIYKGIKSVEHSEIVLFIFKMLLFAVIILLTIFSGHFNLDNLRHFDITNVFLPYGVILFACIGAVAIPEVKEELKNNLKMVKRSIIIGTTIPLLMYALFALAIIGVTGLGTTEIATLGMGNLLGEGMIVIINLFAIISMATSFLAIALALREMYQYDYGMSKPLSWIITVIVPISVVLLGLNSFVETIGITGSIAGSIEGCLLALIWLKARKKGDRKPEYHVKLPDITAYAIMILFIVGGILSIMKLI